MHVGYLRMSTIHDATSKKSTANAYLDDVSCALWGRTTDRRSILRHSKICVMAVKDSIWYMSNICSNTGWRYMVFKVKYCRPKLFKIKDPWSPSGSNLIFKIVDVKIHWSENWRFTTKLGAVWRFAVNINKPVKDSWCRISKIYCQYWQNLKIQGNEIERFMVVKVKDL